MVVVFVGVCVVSGVFGVCCSLVGCDSWVVGCDVLFGWFGSWLIVLCLFISFCFVYMF